MLSVDGAQDALAHVKVPKWGTYEFELKVTAKRRFSLVKLPKVIVRVNDDLEPFPD